MGSGSSHCRRCQQNIDSYGNVQVKHNDYCDLSQSAQRIYSLQRTINDLSWQGNNRRLDQEIIRLKEQNEDFRKVNKELARKNQSLQIAIAKERRVMQQSHAELRKETAELKNDIYAYENELDQANEKMILDAEKIQNQRIQLRNLNKKQEQFILSKAEVTKLNNKVSSLNSTLKRSKTDLANHKRLLKVEKEKVKTIQFYDNAEYELQINDMEQKLKEYQNIINEKDMTEQNPNIACTICFEEYTQDRKRVALGPCGHQPVCVECSNELESTSNTFTKCPICRAEVLFTLALEGVY